MTHKNASSNIIADGITNVLEDFGLGGDDVLRTYCNIFVMDCGGECDQEWEAFADHVQILVGNDDGFDIAAFTASIRAVKDTLSVFSGKSAQCTYYTKYVTMPKQLSFNTATVSAEVNTRPNVDPDIKKHILKDYFLRPVSTCPNKPPVLSKIEYLVGDGGCGGASATGGKKGKNKNKNKEKRYLNGQLVTVKGDKYVVC